MARQISFEVSRADAATIQKICDRAIAAAKEQGVKLDRMDVVMDITACHANGSPLDLDRLLAADDFNFGHDVFGIRRHLDRTTGKLTNHFRPRFSVRAATAA